jgi:hypothetical protein
MKSNPHLKPDHGAHMANRTRWSTDKVKPTLTTHNPPEYSYTPYPPRRKPAPSDAWTTKLKHILPASTVPITSVSKTRLKSNHLKKEHKNGAKCHNSSFSARIDKDGNVIMPKKQANSTATIPPNSTKQHVPSSPTKSSLRKKLRNVKEKSKAMKDKLADAATEDPMIKDPTPATTSTKHHSAPPHPAHKATALQIDKVEAKKEHAAEKLQRREDKVLAKLAADKDARKAALIIKNSNEAPADPALPANKETDDPDSNSLAHTPINNNTYEEPNNGKEDKQEKAKKPDTKATETDPGIDPVADNIPLEEPKAPEPEDTTDLQIDTEEDKEEDGEFLLDTEGGTYDLDDKVLPFEIEDRIYGDKPKTPHAPYPPLPPHSADWTSKKSKHIHKPSSVPITHPPSTTHHNAMSKNTITPSKNINNMATDPVHEELACKEKTATAPVNNVDKYVPRATASHRKSIPPFLSIMLHRKMPLYSLF